MEKKRCKGDIKSLNTSERKMSARGPASEEAADAKRGDEEGRRLSVDIQM